MQGGTKCWEMLCKEKKNPYIYSFFFGFMLKNLNLSFLRLSSGVMYLSIIDIVKSDTSLQACAQCWEMVCKEKKIHIYSFFFGFMLKNSIHLNLGLFLFLFLFYLFIYFIFCVCQVVLCLCQLLI